MGIIFNLWRRIGKFLAKYPYKYPTLGEHYSGFQQHARLKRTMPLALIGCVLLAFSLFWWHAERTLTHSLQTYEAVTRAAGGSLEYNNARRGGWPWRPSLRLTAPRMAVIAYPVTWAGRDLTLSISIFHPRSINLMFGGGQIVQFGQSGVITASTQDFAAELSSKSGVTYADVTAQRLVIAQNDASNATLAGLTAHIFWRPNAREGETKVGLELRAIAVLPDIPAWPLFSNWRFAAPNWPPKNMRIAIAAIASATPGIGRSENYRRVLIQNLSFGLDPLAVKSAGEISWPDANGQLGIHLSGLRATLVEYFNRRPDIVAAYTASPLSRAVMDIAHRNALELPDIVDMTIPIVNGIPHVDIHNISALLNISMQQNGTLPSHQR